MIRYQLVCGSGDRFEAWFSGSADYDRLRGAGAVTCPECGSSDVAKALMAPTVRPAKKQAALPVVTEGTPGTAVEGAPAATGGEAVRLASGPADPAVTKALELVRKLTREIRANADDVGGRFPEEARKIHYGETAPRSIIGEATTAEARELLEEGIAFHPLPALPEDQN